MDAEATVINIICLKYRVLLTHTSLSFGVFDFREITENKETNESTKHTNSSARVSLS